MAQITQIVTPEGKPAAVATKATGWFIHDGQRVESFPDYQWGDAFSEPTSGNDVEFFWTGESYFKAVRDAIKKAKKKIYITGWQINFDVRLGGADDLTLYEHLQRAMDANPALEVYIMPWMSPKVGMDTGDFDTLLAMAQLNAGDQLKTKDKPAAPQRAFTLLAVEQTDMPGSLAIGFSHHQKLVVIDDELAFVGGMDLAYGRRDNGAFFLEADGRTGSELYNPCIPPMHVISQAESRRYVFRWELFSGCFSGAASWTGEFIFSAPALPLAYVQDGLAATGEYVAEQSAGMRNRLRDVKFMPNWVSDAQKAVKDAVVESGKDTYRAANKQTNGALDQAVDTASREAAVVANATARWLDGEVLADLPQTLERAVTQQIRSFTLAWQTRVQIAADQLDERYENLGLRRRLYPRGGKTLSPGQPRMPWHDVQVGIRGPSVTDLSRNFVDRWNGLAHYYQTRNLQQATDATVKRSLEQAGVTGSPTYIKRLHLANDAVRQRSDVDKKAWVQVLRSAPRRMLSDEASAKKALSPKLAQNNCLKAMLTAIEGAKHFLYIEGQFFQSNFGAEPVIDEKAYGPMEAMVDITRSPRWKKYSDELGLASTPQEDIVKNLEYAKVSNVLNDKSFMRDLEFSVKNAATARATLALGKSQRRILNPIGHALIKRIERAVADDQPFHVYMVLPVHPEGTLDTLNIMTQVHYTMQSLIFGEQSLVNGIRRAILAGELMRKTNGLTMKGALEAIEGVTVDELIRKTGAKWSTYLTLLNLRNWTMLKDPLTGIERPVTEQIYVHSKLLIADDLVAIIGSANINDRSQLGDRDSELAVIIRDDVSMSIKIDGKSATPVSAKVCELRRHLWHKLFGLSDRAKRPAHSLASVIPFPASPDTWRAIQKIAFSNAVAYKKAFPFLASVVDSPSSIWPTWSKKTKRLENFMPFHELFWREQTQVDLGQDSFTWAATSRAPEAAPVGVMGFIVAFPETWTKGEFNDSRMNRTLLAVVSHDKQKVA